MKTILLIGAGNLGSRHLQSLCGVKTKLHIDVVEPHKISRARAIERLKESQTHEFHSINFFDSIKCDASYDFAIIATRADVRYQIIEYIFQNRIPIKYMLLEKVLFQSIEHLKNAEKMLDALAITAWVNYPRRLYPFYRDLKNSFSQEKILALEISGGNWGLACNSLHFMDLFEWLTNCKVNSIDLTRIKKQIYFSPREGFVEFFGIFSGMLGNDIPFSIACSEDSADIVLRIKMVAKEIIINETTLRLDYISENLAIERNTISIPFQSQLTKEVFERLDQEQRCDLTTFHDSISSNILFFENFIPLYNSLTGLQQNILNIT